MCWFDTKTASLEYSWDQRVVIILPRVTQDSKEDWYPVFIYNFNPAAASAAASDAVTSLILSFLAKTRNIHPHVKSRSSFKYDCIVNIIADGERGVLLQVRSSFAVLLQKLEITSNQDLTLFFV